MDRRPLLSPRVYAGIVVIVGILALVAFAWWARGISEASQLFQLLHGVLLATMTFVWGAERIERAEARADEAEDAKRTVARAAAEAALEDDELDHDLLHARRTLELLRADPALREKLEAAWRQTEAR